MEGEDMDGVPYISDYIWHYIDLKSDRLSVFYSGLPDDDDLQLVDEFIHMTGRGSGDDDIFPRGGIEPLGWRQNYRSSKGTWPLSLPKWVVFGSNRFFPSALALGANGGVAYIALSRENGRTIFSPASQTPKNRMSRKSPMWPDDTCSNLLCFR